MVRMYLIVLGLRYVYSLIVRVLYRMSFLMIIFGQNIPYIQLFLGSFCTQLKFINIFIFDVDFGIRGILYIFLCKDLIVIMILHLVHFGIFCLGPIERCQYETPLVENIPAVQNSPCMCYPLYNMLLNKILPLGKCVCFPQCLFFFFIYLQPQQ